jgi:hypothetical protein
MMKQMICAFALTGLVGGVASADPAEHNGNFRRAEALRVVGAQKGRSVGLENSGAGDVVKIAASQGNRILLVEHGKKVDYVKAPLDKSKGVSKMSNKDVHDLGLLTQADAKKGAEYNGGKWSKSKPEKVRNVGLARSGDSFLFEQTKPLPVTHKNRGYDFEKQKYSGWSSTETAQGIERSVRIDGSGESARAKNVKYEPIK